MEERRFIKKENGLVKYIMNGAIHYCHENNWKEYELRKEIIEKGVEEKLLEEFEKIIIKDCL